jgi:hypothetical protein
MQVDISLEDVLFGQPPDHSFPASQRIHLAEVVKEPTPVSAPQLANVPSVPTGDDLQVVDNGHLDGVGAAMDHIASPCTVMRVVFDIDLTTNTIKVIKTTRK